MSDEPSMMKYKRGDLIELDKPAGTNFTSVGWRHGANERNGRTGDFPTDGVYVLATIEAPPSDLVSVFSMSPVELEEHMASIQLQGAGAGNHPGGDAAGAEEPYTLEEYSIDFFRFGIF